MVSGEFASMTALHAVVPDVTPVPLSWGTYAQDSNAHFFHWLSKYRETNSRNLVDLIPYASNRIGEICEA